MDRAALARTLDTSAHLTGAFTLRSGATSNEYFDKYLFEANPRLLTEIARHLSALVPKDTEVLAGLELGGIPLVTALSLASSLPAAFVRKAAKTYGTRKVAEGADVSGRRVCVIEDVVTTGGQILTSVADLRALGADVRNVLCVLERDASGRANLDAAGLRLISLLTRSDLR